MNWYKMIATIAGVIISGGAWFTLDYLNRQEQVQAMAMQQGVAQARSEAARRSQALNNFTALITSNQQQCEAAATQAQDDYLNLLQKALPVNKKKPQAIPQAVVEEAATVLANAKALCQQNAAEQLKKGY